MIRRLLGLSRAPCCEDASKKLRETVRSVDKAANGVIGTSLDIINATLEPEVRPYTPDRVREAIDDMRLAFARRKLLRSPADVAADDTIALADEALRFSDPAT